MTVSEPSSFFSLNDVPDGVDVLTRLGSGFEVGAGTHRDERRRRIQVDPVRAVAGLAGNDPLVVLLRDLADGRDSEAALTTSFGRVEFWHGRTLSLLGRVA